nr:MAG TPA: Exonuclease V [Caudoviricetes sp.]
MKTEIIDFFKEIKFDEASHSYTVKGKNLKPVSYVLKDFQEPFDEQKMAFLVAKKKGVSIKEVLDDWHKKRDDSCVLGTNAHAFAENYVKTREGKPSNGYEKAMQTYLDKMPHYVVPLCTELQMYSEKWGIAGTADLMFYDTKNDNIILRDYKGLDVNTPIFTEKGWKTMGTLKEDDRVYDKDGKLCNIKHLSKIHYKKCYKIYFDNSDSIVCDFEHRWFVSKIVNNKRNDYVMTTQEMFDYINDLENIKTNTYTKVRGKRLSRYNQGHNKLKIFNPKPIESYNGNLPIDPYVLGIWLGDGHKADGKITQANENVWEEIEKRGYTLGNDVSQHGCGKAQTRTVFGLKKELANLYLIGNKHIPDIYLQSSLDVKKDLLRGLMDSDGYYNPKRKRFVLSTTREYQVDFCVKLLGSMGIKSTVLECDKRCTSCEDPNKIIKGFDVCFSLKDFNPFLSRNQDIELSIGNKMDYRNILKIEEVETIPTRCIEVDSETHTFLFGKNFCVTHNTNQDLFKNYKGKRLLTPFDDLEDNPFNKYQLQLSLYQILFEQTGFKIENRALIWVKEDGTYEIYRTNDYRDRLIEHLNKNYL